MPPNQTGRAVRRQANVVKRFVRRPLGPAHRRKDRVHVAINEKNGAEIILDHLIGQNVPYMIGVCGHGDVGLMDAALDRKNSFGTISVHNEQTAGFIADAYFRVKRQPLATFTSVDPGSISIQVAIANALLDGSAVFAITGNIPTQQFNRMPFQEIGTHYQADYPSAMRPYVKRSIRRPAPTCCRR